MKRVDLPTQARTFLIFVFISLLLIGGERVGLLAGVRSAADAALVPVEKAAYRTSLWICKPFEMLRFWHTGVARIADLERQVAQLTVEIAQVNELKRENLAMRKLLDAPLPASWSFIPAAVLGKEEFMAIGIGSEQGVSEGDAVVFEEVLLGIVSQVQKKRSSVRLLTHPGSKISVVNSKTGADGLLVGEFGTQMLMTQVLQKDKLIKDDMVVTSGDIGAPRGLVVGTIDEVISGESDVHQKAQIKPLLDIDLLKTVFVVKEK